MRLSLFASTSALLAIASVAPALADNARPIDGSKRPVTLAVIGDAPYGAAQVVDLPNLVADINADPQVERVVHVGDIKNGSSRCDTSYFELIAEQFESFADPLVYTPGDNEWTDCHRSNNGKYDPLERLTVLRDIFFAEPGRTLGGRAEALFTQADSDEFGELVENVAWQEARVVFATLHVVGVDRPLLDGDAVHGVLTAVPNLTRLVVEGETTGEWLKLRIDPRAQPLFSWQRVAR